MKIGILKEIEKSEKRVSISPKIAKLLLKMDLKFWSKMKLELLQNSKILIMKKSALPVEKRGAVYKDSDVLVKINPFDEDGLKLIDKNHILICQLFHKSHPEIVKEIAEKVLLFFQWMRFPEFQELKTWMY